LQIDGGRYVANCIIADESDWDFLFGTWGPGICNYSLVVFLASPARVDWFFGRHGCNSRRVVDYNILVGSQYQTVPGRLYG
jgi:hypothetical protein